MIKKNLKAIFGICLLSILMFTGCSEKPVSKNIDNEKINVVTSIFPYYDFARAVGGEKANIDMLIKPGAESHSYDPGPADIIAIENADIFIYTGGHNDEWVETVLGSINTEGVVILKMQDYVTLLEDEHGNEDIYNYHEEDEHHEEHIDEHIWTSPQNAQLLLEVVCDAYCKVDEANNVYYENNAKNYINAIKAVGNEIKEVVDSSENKLLVFADRFPMAYFANEFGLDCVAAFPGCSTESEASAGVVAKLVNLVREENLDCVYTIELSNGQIARVIQEETGVQIYEMHSCHNVTSKDFAAGETYVSLMKRNVESLKKGLN